MRVCVCLVGVRGFANQETYFFCNFLPKKEGFDAHVTLLSQLFSLRWHIHQPFLAVIPLRDR